MPRLLKNNILVFNEATIKQLKKDDNHCVKRSLGGWFHHNLKATKEMREASFQLEDADTFLKTLKNEPLTLIVDLAQKTCEMMASYELKHPVGQSPKVRFGLEQLREKNDTVQASINELNKNTYTPKELKSFAQQIFLGQCGTLAHLLNGVTVSIRESDGSHVIKDENYAYAKELMNLLKQTHVAYNGDLPDRMALGKNSIAVSFELSMVGTVPNAEGLELQAEFHQEKENETFDTELKKLENTLNRYALYQHHHDDVIQSARAIIAELNELKLKFGKNFDIKYGTTILTHTNSLITDSKNILLQKRYLELTNLAPGTPSMGKKIAGLLLGLLAVTVIVCSLLLILATTGYITLPLAIVATGILAPISINFQAASAAIGIGMLVGSVGLFKRGMRQNLSDKMSSFIHENKLAAKSSHKPLQKTLVEKSQLNPIIGK